MKIKKLISSVLLSAMLFTAVVSVIPMTAEAAYSPDTSAIDSTHTQDEINALIDIASKSSFETAEEMLSWEKSISAPGGEYEGALVTVSRAGYSIHVNKYTGYLYYENTKTGQILTSNPIDTGLRSGTVSDNLISQIFVSVHEVADATKNHAYYSSKWAARYGQISVSYIDNGIRVSYTIGDTSSRVVLPVAVEATKYEEKILKPILNTLADFLNSNTDYFNEDEAGFEFDFLDYDGTYFSETLYEEQPVYSTSGFINKDAVEAYCDLVKTLNTNDLPRSVKNELEDHITALMFFGSQVYECQDPQHYYNLAQDGDSFAALWLKKIIGKHAVTGKYKGKEYNSDNEFMADFNPGKIAELFEVGMPIYSLSTTNLEKDNPAKARRYANILTTYATDYTLQDVYADEADTGTTIPANPKLVVRCALEYTLNADGTLSVELPANSIVYDESTYVLDTIRPLEFFGATKHKIYEKRAGEYEYECDGYAFFPDGSGMITDFTVFNNASFFRPMYGTDYSYSSLNTDFHYLEPVSMPVYGVVTEMTANQTTNDKLAAAGEAELESVTNGYFAVVESGSALMQLCFSAGGATHFYGSSYAEYMPRPSDQFDLSATLSAGSSVSWYKKTANTKFTDSYITRYTMLTDESLECLVEEGEVYYPSSYVGMANSYRDYLKGLGVLEKLKDTEENLPIYIELLGSMEVLKKIMTFPVNAAVELTTFENVETIYKELSNAKATLGAKAKEYRDLAKELNEEDPLYAEYLAEAEAYDALAERVMDITNINFKLTGFANGGLNYTHPTKLKWNKVVGGKRGFKNLIADAKEKGYGVYPDFDFMFIYRTANFDGISLSSHGARFIDNRYASRQLYNSAAHAYVQGNGIVVASDALAELFAKFEEKYSDYGWKQISLSTMGSTLSSDFNEDDAKHREDSLNYVSSLLADIEGKGYDIMVDDGNAYTYAYVKHILNAPVDSSHHIYSTNTVPFVGMVLHSYINYTGTASNYSGSREYDLIRNIESGAVILYTLCYDNTHYMKEDSTTNKYYSVDYQHWKEEIFEDYKKLNDIIGDLQEYDIVNHELLTVEKLMSDMQKEDNVQLVLEEFKENVEKELRTVIGRKMDELRSTGSTAAIKLTVDTQALAEQYAKAILAEGNTERINAAKAELDSLVDEIKNYYGLDDSATEEITYTVVGGYDFAEKIVDEIKVQLIEYMRTQISSNASVVYLNINKDALIAEYKSILAAYITNGDAAAADYIAANPYFVLADEIDKAVAEAKDEITDIFKQGDVEVIFTNSADGAITIDISFFDMQSLVSSDYNISSLYDIYTVSEGTDVEYDYTDNTIDNGNTVRVTYQLKGADGTVVDTVQFLLNFNIYSVEVKLDGEVYQLGKYDFVRIDD